MTTLKSLLDQKNTALFGGLAAVVLAAFGGYWFGTSSSHAPAPQPAAPAAQQASNAPAWVKTESFGPWDVKCREAGTEAGQKTCIAVLEITESKTGKVLLAWIVSLGGEGKLTNTIHTLSGVQVNRGVDVAIGDTPLRHFAYTVCGPVGCNASAPADDEFLKDAVKAGKAKVSVYSTEDKVLNFNVPIDGLDKAVEAIRK